MAHRKRHAAYNAPHPRTSRRPLRTAPSRQIRRPGRRPPLRPPLRRHPCACQSPACRWAAATAAAARVCVQWGRAPSLPCPSPPQPEEGGKGGGVGGKIRASGHVLVCNACADTTPSPSLPPCIATSAPLLLLPPALRRGHARAHLCRRSCQDPPRRPPQSRCRPHARPWEGSTLSHRPLSCRRTTRRRTRALRRSGSTGSGRGGWHRRTRVLGWWVWGFIIGVLGECGRGEW